MKTIGRVALFISLSLTSSIVAINAHGQDGESAAPKPESEKQAVPKPVKPPKPPVELAKDLDGLFEQLGKARDRRLASRISERIWDEWRASDSKSIDLLTGWARTAAGQKRFNQALDLLDQVVVLRPEYAEGYNQRATLHYMMEDYGKSIADIERVLALEPRHFGALAGLASILERINQPKKALETWYRVLAVYPAMKSAQDAVIRLEEDLAGSGI